MLKKLEFRSNSIQFIFDSSTNTFTNTFIFQ